VAMSVISTVQMLISVVVGTYIGQQYDGTVMPITIGFIFASGITLALIYWIKVKASTPESHI